MLLIQVTWKHNLKRHLKLSLNHCECVKRQAFCACLPDPVWRPFSRVCQGSLCPLHLPSGGRVPTPPCQHSLCQLCLLCAGLASTREALRLGLWPLLHATGPECSCSPRATRPLSPGQLHPCVQSGQLGPSLAPGGIHGHRRVRNSARTGAIVPDGTVGNTLGSVWSWGC